MSGVKDMLFRRLKSPQHQINVTYDNVMFTDVILFLPEPVLVSPRPLVLLSAASCLRWKKSRRFGI